MKVKSLRRVTLNGGVAILPLAMVLGAAPAWAQATDAPQALPTTASPDASSKEDKDIVVTGTSIRGVASVGSNSISVSAEDIKDSGASTASEVLATVPQLAGGGGGGTNNFFNAIPQVSSTNATAAGQNAQTQQRPSLRPVPGASGDSGNSTLLLVDGNRTAGAGVNSNAPSANSVPPALLERVELDTDGVSAIYGSDAIAGVINFITKRRFDGVQVTAHLGEADSYSTWDATGIVGKDWGSGSAYISYSHAYASPLFNRDRDYVNPINFATGLERDLNCDTPNVQVAAATHGSNNQLVHYFASTATGVSGNQFNITAPLVGTANVCETNRDATLGNGSKTDNVLGSLAQDFGALKVTLRGHYNYQGSFATRQMSTYSGLIDSTNPYFRVLPGDPGVTSYTVLGNYGATFGKESALDSSSTKEYGGTFEADYDISSKWQVRGTAVYDMSDSTLFLPAITAASQTAGFDNAAHTTLCDTAPSVTTCLNPFNMSASNPALLSNLFTSEQMGVGHDKLLDLKLVADGPLFHLPGGDVRLAFGTEYLRDQFTRGNYTGTIAGQAAGLVTPTATTSDIAGFVEVNIPLVSADNAMPLMRDLRIAASGRYDSYEQFGGTFNPRVGASYKPFDWLKVRGSWNTSFRAPSAIDILGEGYANSSVTPFSALLSNGTSQIFIDPLRPVPTAINNTSSTGAMILALQGTDPNLKPQTGDGWTIAVDFTPIKRLFASVDFYRNDYQGQFGQPCQITACYPNLSQYETVLYDAAGNQAANAAALVAAFAAKGVNSATVATTPLNQIYGLVDTRKTNLGNSYITGIDYQIRYSLPTGFGSVFGSVSGNLQLVSKSQPAVGLAYVNNFVSIPQSKQAIVAQLGLISGGFRGTVTLDHSDGYDVIPSATILQSHVDSYNVVNLALVYDFPGTGLEKGLELSLVVNNIADTAPPLYMTTNGVGYANGSTLGRVVLGGIQKKF